MDAEEQWIELLSQVVLQYFELPLIPNALGMIKSDGAAIL